MGKRSDFERRARDAYDTPASAVDALRPLVRPGMRFMEPCAGAGRLVSHLEAMGLVCEAMSDIEPRCATVVTAAFETVDAPMRAQLVITNPPWTFDVVSALLATQSARWRLPMWLLLQADFAHNRRSAAAMRRCERVVSIGRVRWIEGSPHTSKDNCAWYLFQPWDVAVTLFHARQEAA